MKTIASSSAMLGACSESASDCRKVRPAVCRSIWAHQFVDPGLFAAPKLTDVYREPTMST